jgi:hypothetical protein
MSKTGYVVIASRLVTVTRSCFSIFLIFQKIFFKILSGEGWGRVVQEHESPKKKL